ncbi:MAG: GNAT family N-acetyltransferase [Alteromonadaceae bacterium]|nr:GNAT family N-acetyltransferase [Alteromonadaceae bacterium]
MKFVFLADRKEEVPKLAQWYFDEWGSYVENSSINSLSSKLNEYLNKTEIPLIILAVNGDEVMGAAQLKFREMTIYPEKEHWLGGVYIVTEHRGKNLASALVKKTEEIALTMGVRRLHLQTENLTGGLYARLGWQLIKSVNYLGVDVAVMYKDLSS